MQTQELPTGLFPEKKLFNSYSLLLFIITIIILFACKKSIQSDPGDGNGSGTGTGNGTVQGVITDLNNSPVSNATVTDGSGKNPAFDMAFTIIHANVSSGNIPAGNYPCGFLTNVNRVTYTTEYNNNPPQTTLVEYGSVGGYITGSASGSVFRYVAGSLDPTPLPFTST